MKTQYHFFPNSIIYYKISLFTSTYEWTYVCVLVLNNQIKFILYAVENASIIISSTLNLCINIITKH